MALVCSLVPVLSLIIKILCTFVYIFLNTNRFVNFVLERACDQTQTKQNVYRSNEPCLVKDCSLVCRCVLYSPEYNC